MPIDTEISRFKAEIRGGVYHFCNEDHRCSFLESPRIAYFSMEIGIRSDIPTYSGRLGARAGDSIRSCADLRIPLVAVTLVSRKGYLRQQITALGDQIENPDEWEQSEFMKLLPDTVTLQIEGRDVKIKSWLYDLQSPTGGIVPVIFLDTYLPENDPKDREITDVLYGGDERECMKF